MARQMVTVDLLTRRTGMVTARHVAVASVRSGTAEDGPHGLPEDHEVEGQRPVLHVARVGPHGVVPREVRAPADLPQTGDARLDQQPAAHVEAVLLDLTGDVRARSDEAHAP